MSYKLCLEKAGAKVHKFESFGSYQGEWWALVTFNGETGWINGSYGSCSGCDAFEAEFSCSYEDEENLDEKYAKFGASYLNYLMTQAEAEKATEKCPEYWDDEDKRMYEFIRQKHETL